MSQVSALSTALVDPNINFVNPSNFTMSIRRCPYTSFLVQKIDTPSIGLGTISVPTRFNPIPVSGSGIEFGTVMVEFLVDENLTNYMEIYNWMISLGFPEEHEQYASLLTASPTSGLGVKSDISVIVQNGVKQPSFELLFTDGYPTHLSQLNFINTTADVNFMTCTVEFTFTLMKINNVS